VVSDLSSKDTAKYHVLSEELDTMTIRAEAGQRLFFARQQLVQGLEKTQDIFRNSGIESAIDTLTSAARIIVDVDPQLQAIIFAELGHYYEKFDTRPISVQKAPENYKKVFLRKQCSSFDTVHLI